jgi:hypothetical protein
MSKFYRSMALFLGAVLALTVMNGASARVRTVIREPFNGTAPELGHRWRDIDGDWRRAKGAARIVEGSVSARTNVAYSVRRMSSSYAKRGLAITTRVRLSPGTSNVGIVGPFRDVGNHLFCKVERTRPHPEGFLSIGRRLHGTKPAILVKQNQLGVEAGHAYTLRVTRQRSDVVCTISDAGVEFGRVTYTLRPVDRAAFGTGHKVGIRMRLVARGTRRDEDDGRSAFTSFKVRTLS